MKGHVTALLAISLLTLSPAHADPRAAAHAENMFRVADTNRVRVITIAERNVATEAGFRKHDLDGDGIWSYAEVSKQQLDAGASQLPPDVQAKVIANVRQLRRGR